MSSASAADLPSLGKRPLPRLRWPLTGLLAAGAIAVVVWNHVSARTPVASLLQRVELVPRPGESVATHHFGMSIDEADPSIFKASEVRGWFVVAPSTRQPLQAVYHVRLRFAPLTPFNYQDIALLAAAPGEEVGVALVGSLNPDSFQLSNRRPSKVAPLETGDVEVRWNLGLPAGSFSLVLPPGAAFRLKHVELEGLPTPPPTDLWSNLPASALRICLAVLLALLAVQAAWRPFTTDPRAVKRVLLFGLVASYALVVFLLPPFQAPDEQAHWRDALYRCRPNAMAETPLYYLPDYFDVNEVKHRSDRAVSAQGFRAAITDHAPLPEPQLTGYSHVHTYPVVALVSLAFPRVETVREALLYYYLCRGLHAALLLAMLFVANRNGWLPYSALVIFAFPYVQQQCIAVTSDTVPNLGSVLAALLTLALWRRWSVAGFVCLCLVCIWVILCKPPVFASLLLFPALVFPWRRVPAKWLVFPVAATVLAAAAYFGGMLALDLITRSDKEEEGKAFQERLESLRTPEGRWLLDRAVHTSLQGRFTNLDYWLHPLGWVDTVLTAEHLALLRLLFWIALAIDALAALPYLRAVLTSSYGRALAVTSVACAHILCCSYLTCAALYLRLGATEQHYIHGVQNRYFFPPVLLVVLLPPLLALGQRGEGEGTRALAAGLILLHTFALALLLPLFVLAQVDLASALFVRFW